MNKKLLRQERTLYTLHTFMSKSGKQECNEFYMGVQPDYGRGKTDEEAEELAIEIQRRYNDFHQLLERIGLLIEDYRRKITQCEQMLRVKFQSGSVSDTESRSRIQTKAAEYRAFITELERLKQ